MCFPFLARPGPRDRRLAVRGRGRRARAPRAGRRRRAARCRARAAAGPRDRRPLRRRRRAARARRRRRARRVDGPGHRARAPPSDYAREIGARGHRVLERADGRLRARAVRRRHARASPRPSPRAPGVTVVGGGDSVAALRAVRPGRPRRRTSRPAAARRSSCSRARRLPGVEALDERRARPRDERAHRRLIAGNWKMHKTVAEAEDFIAGLLPRVSTRRGRRRRRVRALHRAAARSSTPRAARACRCSRRTCTRSRAAPSRARCRRRCSPSWTSTASCSGTPSAASTSARPTGRSQLKVPAALEAGLVPILCVGETEEERENDETQRKLRQQVQEDLAKVPEERLAEVVVAYEPIWAIGTGQVATPAQAQEAIAFVRALIGDRSRDAGRARADPVRRQRQARQRGRAAGAAGRGRRAGRRREPRAGLASRPIVDAAPR